ncbi:macrolide-inactivating glycosyltransferase [Nocardioides luteus]|uniref:Macrolide-inactivating glycosyltransferase n=2 Tax=Nocardioides luteus TaxID=1844 RepID=A0ABQ5T0F1_9ACTN|nr:macrolide-inactivating glycosyltransferase [Nocardioides luteus]GLJ69576.1 macrolide-inactivating glycosyltransferase [Nocardioides luteus]
MIASPAISHVLPSIELIKELVARGHRVTYATHDSMFDTIKPTGAELIPVPTVLPVEDRLWPEDPVAGMSIFRDDAIQALPHLHAHYDADPADLYLYDIGGYAARALAEQQGRPFVQLSPTFVAWDGYAEEMAAQVRQLPGYGGYLDGLARWLETCGATTLDPEEFVGAPKRALALIPRAMQPHADRVDEDVVTFVGPCFALDPEETWARPEGAENVLLVSLGSAYAAGAGFFRACVEAYAFLPGWHVVMAIGTRLDPAELGNLPANVEVHGWLPQRAVLARADAFLTHAGMGGSSEGLMAGVPMIAVPQAVDQFMNADKLVELGVARRLDAEEVSAETLRRALVELLDDPARVERSARLRADAVAEGGTRRAAELIEGMLGG